MSTQRAAVQGGKNESGNTRIKVSWWVETLAECLAAGNASELGLPQRSREFKTHDDETRGAGYQVDILYEGVPDGTEDGEDEDWEFDPTFAEEPIETHPEFARLKEDYGGVLGADGRVVFPQTLDGPTNLKIGLASGQGAAVGGVLGGAIGAAAGAITAAAASAATAAAAARPNPLFGLKTYFVTKAVWRRTRTLKRVPKSVLDTIGTVVGKLPTSAIPTPKGRNWLILPPKIQKRGNAVSVADQYMLSGPGGWPPDVYQLIQTLKS